MSGALRFVLIAEDRAHAWLAMTLADRLAVEQVPWLQGHEHEETKLLPDAFRIFDIEDRRAIGLGDVSAQGELLGRFVRKKDIRDLCDRGEIPRVHGLGIEPITATAILALRYFRTHEPHSSAVIMMVDTDNTMSLEETRRCLNEARTGKYFKNGLPFQFVFGACHPEAEAWLICAFEPEGPEEQKRVDDERKRLGVDPCMSGDRLTAGNIDGKRDAKRVLARLISVKETDAKKAALEERSLQGIRLCGLDRLMERGERIGLKAFLNDLSESLVPLYQKKA